MFIKKIQKSFVGIVFVLVTFYSHAQSNDSLKCWNDTSKLSWSDFKGKVPGEEDRSYLKATSAIQLIPVRALKNNLLSYNIMIIFRKYESWALDTAKHLLSHEQLHFDISELYARKLRKAIQYVFEANKNPTEEDYNVVIQKLYLESAKMHAKYDDETIHGIDISSQVEWEKKICIELKKLEKYATTTDDCPVR